MEHGGVDLEKKEITPDQAVKLIKQLAKNLAVVEEKLEFEHRDLHCGNILINDHFEPTIIDFTLSRCKFDRKILFADLDYDPEIFESVGDPQYDVYRQMKKTSDSNWEEFHPKTNALWLAFICGWLSRALRVNNSTIKKKLKSLSTSLKMRESAAQVSERLETAFK